MQIIFTLPRLISRKAYLRNMFIGVKKRKMNTIYIYKSANPFVMHRIMQMFYKENMIHKPNCPSQEYFDAIYIQL